MKQYFLLLVLFWSLPNVLFSQMYQEDLELLKTRVKVPQEIKGRWYSKAYRIAIEFQDYGIQVGNLFWVYDEIISKEGSVEVVAHRKPNIRAKATILLDHTQPAHIQVQCTNLAANCQEGYMRMEAMPLNPQTLPEFADYVTRLSRPSPPLPEEERWKIKYQTILRDKLTKEWFENAQRLDAFPEPLQGFWNCGAILPTHDTFCLAIFPNSMLEESYSRTYQGSKTSNSGGRKLIAIHHIYAYNNILLCSSANSLESSMGKPIFLIEWRNDSLRLEPLQPLFYDTEPIVFTNKQGMQPAKLPAELLGTYPEINSMASLPFSDIKLYAKDRDALILTPTRITIPGRSFVITHILQNNFYPVQPNTPPNYTILAVDTFANRIFHFALTFDKSFETWNIEAEDIPALFVNKLSGRILNFRKLASPALVVTQRQMNWIALAVFLSPFIFLLLLIGGITWFRATRRKRRQAQLALRGIRAQLNPHFLFNALASIQSLINQQHTERANQYLSGFSRLMRHTLDHAAQDYLPLQEELEALEQYCKLEALRAPFDYRIEVDPAIDPFNTDIPTMLLQPFVENAILHGLRDHPGQPLLEIVIFKQAKKLIAMISDNGPGIQAVEERNEDLIGYSRKKYGFKLSKERIELLNLRRRRKITLQVLDRQTIDNQSGTKVILSIPD